MKEKIKSILIKHPLLYRFFQNFYWKIQATKIKVLGTKLIERIWLEKDFNLNEELKNLNHPHRPFLIERISSFRPESILEIGCGWGSNLFLLAKALPKAKIKGVDINQKAIEKGKEFLIQKGIDNVELLVGKADEINHFQDKSFDLVFTDAVLMYIGQDKIKKMIRAIFRIAKKALILVE